ncbi:MAG TPA: isoprenylcysteine carboxylmethyltransferase family protein [Ignavibacteria bacterium]|nr:isoprenylcysteine carboxylmethyltransferase family protein [Ignavibacteria bacterium]
MTLFIILYIFLIVQRLTELFISKRNENYLLNNGGVEFGKSHYKYIVIMHALFLISLPVDFFLSDKEFVLHTINYLFLVIFIILQFFRVYVLSTLGKFWNTRIILIPGSKRVKKGIYKIINHPNYVIVICEIFVIPMIFNLYLIAIVFTVLNAIILTVRIKEENKALKNLI